MRLSDGQKPSANGIRISTFPGAPDDDLQLQHNCFSLDGESVTQLEAVLMHQQCKRTHVDVSTQGSYRVCMPSAAAQKQLDIWRGFRFMVEETSLGVSRALSSSTGMSGGEFGILSNLAEAPLHSMRQQQLADAMRWDRTRLSHQLTRMERRGWIKRKSDGRVTLVFLAEAGKEEQSRVAPMLNRILQDKFFSRLTQTQLASLDEIRRALDMDTPSKT